MIDYKALLEKYMNLVCTEEGTTFVSRARSYWKEDFTEEELTELERMNGPEVVSKEPLIRPENWSIAMKQDLLKSLETLKAKYETH